MHTKEGPQKTSLHMRPDVHKRLSKFKEHYSLIPLNTMITRTCVLPRLQKMLDHTSLQPTAIYARLDLTTLSTALQRNADRFFSHSAPQQRSWSFFAPNCEAAPCGSTITPSASLPSCRSMSDPRPFQESRLPLILAGGRPKSFSLIPLTQNQGGPHERFTTSFRHQLTFSCLS